MAQADEFTYLLAKTAWMSSGKYLLLVKTLIDNWKVLEQGSLDGMMNEGRYKDYAETQEEVPEGMSDMRSLIPFIYSIYNSVEQILLAYYYASFPHEKLTFVPTFERLEEKFDEYNLAKNEIVTKYVHKYSDDDCLPKLLKGLLDASGYQAEHFKGTRRALENNNLFNVLDKYQPYYYSVEEGRAFFAEVYEDTKNVLEVVNAFVADIDDDGKVGSLVASLEVKE